MDVHCVVSRLIKNLSFSVEKGILKHLGFEVYDWLSHRFSILPALSLDGILAVKIVKGSFTTEWFKDFIDGLLDHMTPFPGPNLVIIMDNCHIHCSQSNWEMIEEW